MVIVLLECLCVDIESRAPVVTLKELLMSGLPEIDPDDWQVNTEYSGDDYSEDHPVIKVNVLLEILKFLNNYLHSLVVKLITVYIL